MLTKILQASKREIRDAIREPWLVVMFCIMPVVWCALLAGIFYSSYLRELPVGIVNLDHSVESQEVEARIDALPSIALVSQASPESAKHALQRGDLYAYLIIPKDWASHQGRPDAFSIEAYFPKSLYAVAVSLELDLKGAFAQMSLENLEKLAMTAGATTSQAKAATHVLSVQSVTLGNLYFNFNGYMLPVLIPGLLHLGIALVMVSRLSSEWQRKSVGAWVQNAGGSFTAAILGKFLPWWLFYSLLEALYIAFFTGFLGEPAQGSVLLWTAGLSFFLGVMATLPLFVMGIAMRAGWVISTSFCVGYIAPIFPFTGFSYPLDAMQPWLQAFCQLFPLTHYVQFQAQEWILGSPLTVSLWTLGKIAIFGLVWAGLGLLLFKKQMAAQIALEKEHK